MSTPAGALHGYHARGPARPSPTLDHWKRALAFIGTAVGAVWRVLAALAREPAFLTLPLDSPVTMDKPIGVLQGNIHREW